MTLHEEWTDKLSDFLDDELTPEERYAVESHLQGCEACAAVLDELKQVVARARALEPRPSRTDLWPGIVAQIEAAQDRAASGASILPMRTRAGWRVTFTLPQLAAASALIAAMSGGLVWSLRSRVPIAPAAADRSAEASRSTIPGQPPSVPDQPSAEREALAERA